MNQSRRVYLSNWWSNCGIQSNPRSSSRMMRTWGQKQPKPKWPNKGRIRIQVSTPPGMLRFNLNVTRHLIKEQACADLYHVYDNVSTLAGLPSQLGWWYDRSHLKIDVSWMVICDKRKELSWYRFQTWNDIGHTFQTRTFVLTISHRLQKASENRALFYLRITTNHEDLSQRSYTIQTMVEKKNTSDRLRIRKYVHIVH